MQPRIFGLSVGKAALHVERDRFAVPVSRFVLATPRRSRRGDAEIFGLPRSTGTFIVHVTMTDADGIAVSNDFPLRISGCMVPEGLPKRDHQSALLRTSSGDWRNSCPYTATIIGGALPAGSHLMPERSI